MDAKVTKPFIGRRDNATVSETFPVGEHITGDLARVAVDMKSAEEIKPKDAEKLARTTAKVDEARRLHSEAIEAHEKAAADKKADALKVVEKAKSDLDDAEVALAKLQ